MAYAEALELQHRVVAARQAGQIGDVLLLVEHDPVITLGRRADPTHILVPDELLAQAGVAVHRVERGGDVTYHGPGQLVGYPILHLEERGLGAADYVHRLEDLLLAVLADFGLEGHRRQGIIGVWLGHDKVGALGVRIARHVSYHGFALNVNTDLRHFGLIIPCGITDGGVTSMARALGQAVDWQAVVARTQQHFAALFQARLQSLARSELEALLVRR
jgi:lipoate-protein ligase B